ncbi:hypothetical protein [uncultured Methanofollis sp.]|uniref:hypothetical protein n=1 Tax=uncultured Methanofollis sp. TaxID=262500 RepID=UPI00260AA1AA|nr:hypothetical protein [uncultured Methanofollis sp.]
MATGTLHAQRIKKGICCLLLGSLLVISAGAISVDWTGELNTTFHKGTYTDIFAAGQTGDGGYLLGGFGYGNGNDSALLIKTDSKGVEQWNTTPGGDCVVAVVPLEDGGAIVGAYTVDGGFLTVTDWANATGASSLSRIDAAGTPLWNVTIDGLRLTGLDRLPDDKIAVSGWLWKHAGETETFVGIYDLAGTEVRAETYPERAARTIATAADGSIFVGGTDGPTVEGSVSSWIMKTDASGKEMWAKDLADRILLTSLAVDDGYLLGGSMTSINNETGRATVITDAWAAKTDDAGVIEWEQKIPGFEVHAMAEIPGTGYVLAGRWGSVPQVQVIDYNGKVVDGQVWNAWKGRLSSVFLTQSGEIVSAGWSRMDGNADGWVVSSAAVQDAGMSTETPTPSQTGTPEAPGFLIATAGTALAIAGFLRYGRK